MSKTVKRAELIYNHIKHRTHFFLDDLITLFNINDDNVRVEHLPSLLKVVASRYKISWVKEQKGKHQKNKYLVELL